MADRKIDYFGTFLENMKQSGPEAEPRQKAARRAFPGSDRLNEVLKSLRGGPRGAKDLLPLTGNSITEFLAIRDQLVDLGWVSPSDGDALELTPKGAEVAALLA